LSLKTVLHSYQLRGRKERKKNADSLMSVRKIEGERGGTQNIVDWAKYFAGIDAENKSVKYRDGKGRRGRRGIDGPQPEVRGKGGASNKEIGRRGDSLKKGWPRKRSLQGFRRGR